MLDELGPLLNNLPPKTVGALVQAINRCSEELGIGPDWVRRWMGFTVVSDALARYAPEGQRVFELKGGVVDGEVVDPRQIAELAKLPSLDALRGVMIGLLSAPATKLVRLLVEPGTQLARLVEARRAQQESDGAS